MTTQILSESWALTSGSRYWTGVCCGEGLGWEGISYTGFPPQISLSEDPTRPSTPPQLCVLKTVSQG